MEKHPEGWALQLNLSPGKYEYKFIVDGKWMHDPNNRQVVVNQHGTLNSILFIKKTIHFELAGHTSAEEVILTGSFNGWNEEEIKMKKSPHGWYAELDLSGGKHLYKFIVDGKWITDPSNKLTEKDRSGNNNSVLLIR